MFPFMKRVMMLLSSGSLCYGFLNRDPLSRTAFYHDQVSAPTVRLFTGRQRAWAKQNKKNDNFDMKELKQRINELTNPYHDLFAADWKLEERPEFVHIILFKPDTEDQGVHTIEYPKGSGSNFVLAFQSQKACDKFAASLKAQNFDNLSPKRFQLDALESLGDMLGVFVQVVPNSVEILPPTKNVENLGQHNPHLKDEKTHLDYIFNMFELEVDELGLVAVAESAGGGCWE